MMPGQLGAGANYWNVAIGSRPVISVMVMVVEVAAAADRHDGGDAGERQDADVAVDGGDHGASAARAQDTTNLD